MNFLITKANQKNLLVQIQKVVIIVMEAIQVKKI